MKVLIACEFSGIVSEAFRRRGHTVLSCDFLPSEKAGSHYTGDVKDVISPDFDMMIAFPPCTYLCCAGRRHWKNRIEEQKEALDFVRFLLEYPIHRIALENPVGIISTRIRKPTQIVQPYYFGEMESKKTCLWLKNVPDLYPTCIMPLHSHSMHRMGKENLNRAKDRSRTFQGIADAMASQWSDVAEYDSNTVESKLSRVFEDW